MKAGDTEFINRLKELGKREESEPKTHKGRHKKTFHTLINESLCQFFQFFSPAGVELNEAVGRLHSFPM